MLPDVLASRYPGTLDAIEAAVVTYESSPSLAAAADEVRPPDAFGDEVDPITLEATTRWLRRRVRLVSALLVTIAGLYPELFAGCEMSLTAFRLRLGTPSALVALRGIVAVHLPSLPPPLGFGPWPKARAARPRGLQQSPCPDRPP